MKFYSLTIVLLLSFVTSVQANVLERKGKWSFYYGYNRASYSNSDYHLTGKNYDFTLKNVVAHDGQVEPSATYLLPWALSVPQNDTRFSYFLTDNFAISIGSDHMKYIMDSPQTVGFDGYIATGEGFDRSGKGTQTITGDFLKLKHTDGLNYVSVEFEHFAPLWVSAKKTQALSFFWGPGVGILFPMTDASLFGRPENDQWNVAGTGYSLKAGLEFNFTEEYFMQFIVKHGQVDMPNVKTTSNSADKLAQKFAFKQMALVVGLYF